MDKKFDLSALKLTGTSTITVKAKSSIYADSALSDPISYTSTPAMLYPPTIGTGSPSAAAASGIYIVDNPANAGKTVSYNVYLEDGTYYGNILKTAETMSIAGSSGTPGGCNVYVKAVDGYGYVSKPSNIAWSNTCFVAGTPISMADGTYKMIEEVQVGDEVKSYNFKTSTYCNGTVTKVATGYTTRIAMVLFEDGNYVAMSEGHPLYTRDGWHSITNKDGYPTLVIGDKVLGKSTYVAIQDIQVVDTEPTIVYSLGVTVSNGEDMFDGAYFAGIGNMTLSTHSGGSN